MKKAKPRNYTTTLTVIKSSFSNFETSSIMGDQVALFHIPAGIQEAKEIPHTEDQQGNLLTPFRVGAVHYLNAAPLTYGLEDELWFDKPSTLAKLLRSDELDAALVSVAEVLFNDHYEVLDGTAIGSVGEVKSVILAHRKPIEEVREVYCDTASLTSVNLLRVILAERGLKPEFKALPSYDFESLPDFALLIGDPALDFVFSNHSHQILDMGSAWREMTGLPFVYGVWALRRGVDTFTLRRQLTAARQVGMSNLEHIVHTRTEYSEEFRREYFARYIHYSLGQEQKRGIAKFTELLRKHTGGPVYDTRFVQ
ncbi:hypothetical protein EDB81DRAFT_808570 [Dactylonectria macrodidyma]|uniref:Chorismate dehydratase n=1 Tax=Dactylonectria macrodidyma TaxID=307937 RepID=A0A9P9E1Q5_9HYPO|nr:hypothetical protein EDB81DRAFT_808570 [Dactylonectria macrodidyma]